MFADSIQSTGTLSSADWKWEIFSFGSSMIITKMTETVTKQRVGKREKEHQEVEEEEEDHREDHENEPEEEEHKILQIEPLRLTRIEYSHAKCVWMTLRRMTLSGYRRMTLRTEEEQFMSIYGDGTILF